MRYEFSDCVLDTAAHSLTRAGQDRQIEPQVFDLLALLVNNPGVLVTKDQLIDAIWGGRIVSDSAISARIAAARKAVGDDGKRQAIIRTVARRGLQFVADIAEPPAAPQPAAATPSGPPKIRYATADDGAKIAFAVSGRGPPLIRVAHYPSHLELEWAESTERALFDAVGEHHTLIRTDHRGSGLSDLAVDEFSATRSAKDIEAVADTLGLDRFALFGSSSGAMTAIECAAMVPDRVSHLMTLGGYADGLSVRENGSDDIILNLAKTGWTTPDSAFVTGYLAIYFPTAGPELLRQIAHQVQSSCPIENEVRAREVFNHHSVAGILGKVEAPTLVMHSRHDAVHPLLEAQKLARGIPDAQLMVLESRNHYPLPDEASWQAMIAAMLDFLNI